MEETLRGDGHPIVLHLSRYRVNRASSIPSGANYFNSNRDSYVIGSPTLPAEAPFGIVHLGEKFSSKLNIHNEGQVDLQAVKVKIELQTSTNRSVLQDSEEFILKAGINLDFVIAHEIREIGVHIMVCTIAYMNPITYENKVLRKFFKFSTINPLTLKTKVTELRDMLLLEAQIQNVSSLEFYLGKVIFESVEDMSCQIIIQNNNIRCSENNLMKSMESLNIENSQFVAYQGTEDEKLEPDEMYQYLFIIVPQFPFSTESPLPLGRLDIHWHAEGGEEGRLQTGILTHRSESSNAVKIIINDLPKEISLYKPCKLLVVIQNGTSRTFENIRLAWDWILDPNQNSPALVLAGLSEINMGSLTGLNSTRIYIDIIPTSVGIQTSELFFIKYKDGDSEIVVPFEFTLFVIDKELDSSPSDEDIVVVEADAVR